MALRRRSPPHNPSFGMGDDPSPVGGVGCLLCGDGRVTRALERQKPRPAEALGQGVSRHRLFALEVLGRLRNGKRNLDVLSFRSSPTAG